MAEHRFTAFALAGELDLNKLSADLGHVRKYRWEEPMLLSPLTLAPIGADCADVPQVYLYHFGGVVFVDCEEAAVPDFVVRMGRWAEPFRDLGSIRHKEHYSLRESEGGPRSISNDCAVVPRCDSAFIGIVAFVIAKSVALERIEDQVDEVMDDMEALLARLERGKLAFADKRLAKVASRILNFKYRSIAYVMVLDKPEITWESQEADRLYLTMANLFELNQRYHEIRHKADTLMDITEVFSNLSHARRAQQLEWVIIILIFIEIVIYLFQIM